MARITLRQLLDHAAEHGYGVPAFNINNMEQGLAIMAAAEETRSPVILQASRGARAYAGDVVLARLIDGFVAQHPEIPVCMHLDHGNALGSCATAIQHGFTSVMMDGSLEADGRTPADYAYNVGVTARVSEMAHACGVSVEGELGVLGSLETGGGAQEDGHGFEGTLEQDRLLTDPEDAARFVADTRVDALAVAMGTSHGAYKFTRRPDGEVLAMHVIEAIHRRIPDTHLVMHGSSSVPEALQELINRHGGEIKPTWGVPVEEIQRGIRHGVRKINIDTDNRMAMTGAIRRVLAERPEEFDPRKYLVPAMAEMQALCEERFEQFGCAGHADRIRPIPLEAMARRYASGGLDPKVA
jgi:fructose-bisphosphate aldolase, class II